MKKRRLTQSCCREGVRFRRANAVPVVCDTDVEHLDPVPHHLSALLPPPPQLGQE